MMIGQQEAAGAEADVLGLQKRLREQEIGRRMRLPWRGVVLADPGFLIAELVEPAQHLQVPVVTLLQPALRRMGRHREISDFHGASSRCCFQAPLVGVRASFVSQCLRCGDMTNMAEDRASAACALHPRLGAGDDLHRNTGNPADHDQPCPGDMRLLAQDDDADREERRQRRAEGAGGGEEFRGVDLGIVIGMEHELRGVDADIKADRADKHHDQQKALRGQRADRGADMGGDEQAAGGARHRKADAFKDVRGLPDAEPHGLAPPIASGQLSLSPARQKSKGGTMLRYRVPNVVAPNSAFCVEGCERQYCGGAATSPPSSAAACQPQRGS